MSLLAVAVVQAVLAATPQAFAENYPNQRHYQRYLVMALMDLPVGAIPSDEELVVAGDADWDAVKPAALRAVLREWHGKQFILLGPRGYPISCSRQGMSL